MALKRPTHTRPSRQSSRPSGRPDAATSRKVAAVARKALGANPAGAAVGADLGGSSKYSREALEDRCGEGFRVNSR